MSRMSNAERERIVLQIRAIAGEFNGNPEVAAIVTELRVFEDRWWSGQSSVIELLALQTRLNAFVTARLFASEAKPPTIEPSVSVTLWGTDAGDLPQAAILARHALSIEFDCTQDVTLVDNTRIANADAVGTRYVFRAVSA